MLQRQIMFKQLQELQRRQQLQELSDTRNQNYGNQLSSLKQSSGGQFSNMVNGTPIQDPSGMFMVGNMMQHGGTNGLVLSQSSAGLSQPQLDLYANPDKNLNQYSYLQGQSNLPTNLLNKNTGSPLGMVNMQPSAFSNSFMSQHSNFPSDQINMPDGLVQSNQEKDFFGQAPTEGLYGAALSGNYSEQGIAMHGNASAPGSEGRHEVAGWGGLSPGKASNFGLSEATDSLDPLEQKILYNTDDNIFGSFSSSSKMNTGGFEGKLENMSNMDGLSSIQSGSWSALMQSALEETSGNDPGVQEEWSGLSFQNPEPSDDNQPTKFSNSQRLQNDWVNRNSPNVVSPSSKPEHLFHSYNMNSSVVANFQQPSYQYQKQKDEYHSETSHQNSPRSTSLLDDYNSQQRRSSEGTSLMQTSNIWPRQNKESPKNDVHEPSLLSNENQPRNNFSGNEFKGAFWLQGSTSHRVSGGIPKQYDQMSKLNTHGYSVEPENISGINAEAVSVSNASLERSGAKMTAPSESMLDLLNKDDTSNDQSSSMQLNLKVSTPREMALTETSVPSFAKPCNPSPLPAEFGFRSKPSDLQTSQSNSVFPPLSIVGKSNIYPVSSSATSLSSHNVNNHIENQHPALPVPSHMNAEVPLSGNLHVAQSSLTSDRLQVTGFGMGQPTQWQGMAPQQDTSSPKPCKFSSNLFRSPDSASSRTGTSSTAPNEQQYQNSCQQEYNTKQYSGNSAGLQQQFEKGSFTREGLSGINRSTSLSNTEFFREHEAETGAIGSGSLINDDAKSFPPKYDSVNYQHPSANTGELSLSGQSSGNIDTKSSHLNAVSCLGAFSYEDNKGWKLSQEDQGDQSGKALLTSYHQNFHQQSMLSQNDILTRSVGNNITPNAAYPSQISLPMVQSWFNQYEISKNGQRLPIYDPRAAIPAVQPSSEMTPGNMKDNSLNMQVNVANSSQGSVLQSPTAMTPVLHKQLNPPSILPSDVSQQNSAVTLPKKRKLVAFDMIAWHKEVNHSQSKPQDISIAELSWTQAANKREEEVISEAEIVEELHPVIQAKRRLICTTQLMQQIFRPAPSVIICMDASSICDYIAYYAARIALGDACSLTCQWHSNSGDVSDSRDKPKTTRGTDSCKFSKVVEGNLCRVKKLEDDLTRLEKSLSVVDIKVEAQELEKFSTINRFAKFHVRSQPGTVDMGLHKTHPQRYVVGHPMPKVLPEGVDCISL